VAFPEQRLKALSSVCRCFGCQVVHEKQYVQSAQTSL
jgi:RNA polymerase-binding transcription factor DksA